MDCEERTQLYNQLREANAAWYAVKDIPGKERESKKAHKKAHHIGRALGDHIKKHGCTRDSD